MIRGGRVTSARAVALVGAAGMGIALFSYSQAGAQTTTQTTQRFNVIETTTTAPGTGTATTGTPTTRPGTTGTATTPTTLPTTTTATPSAGVAQVSDSTVQPGQAVTVSGGGFAPNQSLQMTFFSHANNLGTTRSDAAGNFNASVRIPADATAGSHRIVVSGPAPQGSTRESAANVTVDLARTGSSDLPLVVAGLAALVVGARAVRAASWTPAVSTAGWTPSRRRWAPWR